jgi:hypothetical protein
MPPGFTDTFTSRLIDIGEVRLHPSRAVSRSASSLGTILEQLDAGPRRLFGHEFSPHLSPETG